MLWRLALILQIITNFCSALQCLHWKKGKVAPKTVFLKNFAPFSQKEMSSNKIYFNLFLIITKTQFLGFKICYK